MKLAYGNSFNIGRRLMLTLALLISLILAGNGLVILQFERARVQTDRLTHVSQQLIAVLRLQESLLSFHHQLSELVESKDAHRLPSIARRRASLTVRVHSVDGEMKDFPEAARLRSTADLLRETIGLKLRSLKLQNHESVSTQNQGD